MSRSTRESTKNTHPPTKNLRTTLSPENHKKRDNSLSTLLPDIAFPCTCRPSRVSHRRANHIRISGANPKRNGRWLWPELIRSRPFSGFFCIFDRGVWVCVEKIGGGRKGTVQQWTSAKTGKKAAHCSETGSSTWNFAFLHEERIHIANENWGRENLRVLFFRIWDSFVRKIGVFRCVFEGLFFFSGSCIQS